MSEILEEDYSQYLDELNAFKNNDNLITNKN